MVEGCLYWVLTRKGVIVESIQVGFVRRGRQKIPAIKTECGNGTVLLRPVAACDYSLAQALRTSELDQAIKARQVEIEKPVKEAPVQKKKPPVEVKVVIKNTVTVISQPVYRNSQQGSNWAVGSRREAQTVYGEECFMFRRADNCWKSHRKTQWR